MPVLLARVGYCATRIYLLASTSDNHARTFTILECSDRSTIHSSQSSSIDDNPQLAGFVFLLLICPLPAVKARTVVQPTSQLGRIHAGHHFENLIVQYFSSKLCGWLAAELNDQKTRREWSSRHDRCMQENWESQHSLPAAAGSQRRRRHSSCN